MGRVVLPQKELHAALDKCIVFTEDQEFYLPDGSPDPLCFNKENTPEPSYISVEIRVAGYSICVQPIQWEDDVSNNGSDESAPDSSPVLE